MTEGLVKHWFLSNGPQNEQYSLDQAQEARCALHSKVTSMLRIVVMAFLLLSLFNEKLEPNVIVYTLIYLALCTPSCL